MDPVTTARIPLRPDPDLIDNAEGNRRILKADKDAAVSYLATLDGERPAACPVCGAVSGASLAQPPALLAVCDVLVVRALEAVGKRIVRAERARYNQKGTKPWHMAHTLWAPDDGMMKALEGAWDVVPAMLDSHGCCGVTSSQVTMMLNKYVRDLLITGTAHELGELRYRFEAYLGIELAEPARPYNPPST